MHAHWHRERVGSVDLDERGSFRITKQCRCGHMADYDYVVDPNA